MGLLNMDCVDLAVPMRSHVIVVNRIALAISAAKLKPKLNLNCLMP
jgi:hypothetical protein